MCGKKKTETEPLTNEKETEDLSDEKAWKKYYTMREYTQIRKKIYMYIMKIEGKQK